jgi:hypothetical protein
MPLEFLLDSSLVIYPMMGTVFLIVNDTCSPFYRRCQFVDHDTIDVDMFM